MKLSKAAAHQLELHPALLLRAALSGSSALPCAVLKCNRSSQCSLAGPDATAQVYGVARERIKTIKENRRKLGRQVGAAAAQHDLFAADRFKANIELLRVPFAAR